MRLFCAIFFAIAAHAGDFAALDQWKAAVASGDKAALGSLYSQTPPAAISVANKPDDVAAAVRYWSDLKSAGATEFSPKVLEATQSPQRVQLVLRIEFEQGGNKMYGPVTQLWVRQGADWRIAAEARSARFYPDAARTLPVPQTPNVELYSDPSRAQAELDEALTRARAEHKRVIAVFGANWCYDCHVLDAAFHSNGLAPLVNANFIVVHISVGDDGRANNDLAARLGVPLDKGVPALAVLDPDGEVVYAQKYGEFEASEKISPSDLRGFLEKWRPIR